MTARQSTLLEFQSREAAKAHLEATTAAPAQSTAPTGARLARTGVSLLGSQIGQDTAAKPAKPAKPPQPAKPPKPPKPPKQRRTCNPLMKRHFCKRTGTWRGSLYDALAFEEDRERCRNGTLF